jgi:hypothetical protein
VLDDFEVVKRGEERQPEWARRIERKLDTLIAALAEEEGEESLTTLDGQRIAARDTRRGLG